MTSIAALVCLAVYTLSLAYSTMYCLTQLNLARHYLRFDRQRRRVLAEAHTANREAATGNAVAAASSQRLEPFPPGRDCPRVTIQLPVYNETPYYLRRCLHSDSVTADALANAQPSLSAILVVLLLLLAV